MREVRDGLAQHREKEGTVNHPAQPPGQARYLNGNLVSVIATDYGGTISLDRLDHLLGQKPVDPAAAATLRVLHEIGRAHV